MSFIVHVVNSSTKSIKIVRMSWFALNTLLKIIRYIKHIPDVQKVA